MSRNLLRKTKRENVQTLLYQTLNFARVVVGTDPYKDTEAISLSSPLLLARSATRAEGVTLLREIPSSLIPLP